MNSRACIGKCQEGLGTNRVLRLERHKHDVSRQVVFYVGELPELGGGP